MAEGKKPDIDVSKVFPENDIEFMADMLRLSGRFNVIAISDKEDKGARPKVTSTPLKTEEPDSHNPLLQPLYSTTTEPAVFIYPPTPISAISSSHRKRPILPSIIPSRIVEKERVSSKLNITVPDSTDQGHDHRVKTSVPSGRTFLDSSVLASMRIPQLPPFSGENQKGDVSFEVWRYELHCLVRDAIYPDTLILLAVRRSLKGRARDILLTIDETARPSDILTKLEGIYGNVSSSEVLMQQFYSESQKSDESVADYSIRIENLLRRATQFRRIDVSIKDEMLCSKLWNGLKDPLLKNSTRYKYDTERNFNNLRKEIRSIEQDLSTSPSSNVVGPSKVTHIQQVSGDNNSSKLDSVLKEMRQMRQRMNSIERKFKEATSKQPAPNTVTAESTSASFQSGSTRGRGVSYQHRGRGGGRGGRGYSSYKDNQYKSKSGNDSKSNHLN